MKQWTASALHALIAPRADHHAARLKIRHLDLEPIKFKLVKESGWDLAKADRVGALYKGFLLLHILHPRETHIPTHEIDDMWHAHILDTAKYMADCHTLFGHYLHHFPYVGLRGGDDAAFADQSFIATRQRMMEICGVDPLAGDDISAADCGGGGGCSSSSCSSSSCSSTNDTGGGSDKGGGSDSGGDKGSGGKGNDKGRSGCGVTPLPFNDPARGNTPSRSPDRTPPQPPKDTPPARRPEPPKKPLWQRILGLSGAHEAATEGALNSWDASVDPASMLARAARPGRAELLLLAEVPPADVTRH